MTSKKTPPKSATDDAEQLEIQAGRRAPFTMAPDWILLAPVTRDAKILYWALAAHISQSRDDSEVWPTQEQLARLLGYAKRQAVADHLAELVQIGAVDTRKIRTHGGMRQRTIYTIHQTPPPEWNAPESLQDFYRSLKEESSQVTPEVPHRGRPDVPCEEHRDVPHEGPREVPTQGQEQDELEQDELEQHHGAAAAAGDGGGESMPKGKEEQPDEGGDSPEPAGSGVDVREHARHLLRVLRLPRGQRFNVHDEAERHVARAVQAGVPDVLITEYLLEGTEDAHTPGAIVTMRCRQLDGLIADYQERQHRPADDGGDQEDVDTDQAPKVSEQLPACRTCGAFEGDPPPQRVVENNDPDSTRSMKRCPDCRPSGQWRDPSTESVADLAHGAAVTLGLPA